MYVKRSGPSTSAALERLCAQPHSGSAESAENQTGVEGKTFEASQSACCLLATSFSSHTALFGNVSTGELIVARAWRGYSVHGDC